MSNAASAPFPQALPPGWLMILRNAVVARWVFAAAGLALIAGLPSASLAADPAPLGGLYDQNPDHLWNRLHRALFVRQAKDGGEYGYDDTVPFNPVRSETLLTGEAHQKAVTVLDEFLFNHGEELVRDPVKHAVLQHDLWAAFDNQFRSHPIKYRPSTKESEQDRRDLLTRLAHCIQRLALADGRIAALPDNFALAAKSGLYAESYDPKLPEKPFLPPDLFDPQGPWVKITFNTGSTSNTRQVEEVIAPVHVKSCSGRSEFELFLRLPGGRDETLAYLEKLNQFTTPWKYAAAPEPTRTQSSDHRNVRGEPLRLHPDTPQFPAGTMVALARRMMLVNAELKPVATPLLESVQLRVYCQVPATYSDHSQDAYEFVLRRAKLFAGEAGGLHALGNDESEPNILGIGVGGMTVKDCRICHSGSGIFSVQSYTRGLAAPVLSPQLPPDPRPNMPWNAVAYWKQRQFDWGFLTGLLNH